IQDGTTSLLGIVEALGPTLTNEDAAVRARGTELLSAVLKQTAIPNRTIPNLTQFYLSRLHDHQSVPALLDGLESILKSDKIAKSQAVTIPVHLVENFNVQGYQQSVRHKVFQIVQHSLDKYTPELRKEPQFLPGFINALEGEKDPRNLLLGFKLTRDLIDALDIQPYAEELFELLFSYFPITFRPPPDDVYGITAEHLKNSLSECLRSTSAFAEYAMPALVEKLGTTSGAAKVCFIPARLIGTLLLKFGHQRDAVELIAACAPVYGIAAVAPHIENIWELLKDDVEKAQEDSAEQKNALFCVRSILATLSSSPAQNSMNPLEKLLKLIVTDCLSHMKEPESKLARTGGRLVVAAASSSDSAFSYAAQVAVPKLLSFADSEPEPKRRKTSLDVLADLAVAGIALYGPTDNDGGVNHSDDLSNPLLQFKDALLATFRKAAGEDRHLAAVAVPGARGLRAAIQSRLVGSEEAEDCFARVLDAMLASEDPKVREECLADVLRLEADDPSLTILLTIPRLLDNLDAAKDLEWHLHCLKEVTLLHTESAPSVLSALIRRVAAVRERLDSTTSEEGDEEAQLVLGTVLAIAEKLGAQSTDFADALVSLVVLPLWAECFRSVSKGASFAQTTLPPVSNITTTVVRSLSVVAQQSLVAEAFKTPLPVPDAAGFLRTLFQEAAASESPVLTISLAKAASSLINKLYDGKVWRRCGPSVAHSDRWPDAPVRSFVQEFVGTAGPQLQDMGTAETERRRVLILLIWVLRAVVLRSAPEHVQRVVALLGDATLGGQAAESFTIYISDSEQAISKANHAVVKPLYRQKFFGLVFPLLLAGCGSSNDGAADRANSLTALVNILADVPPALIAQNLAKIFPLLLDALAVPNSRLKAHAVGFVRSFSDSSEIIAGHAPSAVAKLLALLEPTPTNTESVRSEALRALAAIALVMPYDRLHPLKPSVLRALDRASDDRRKAIRREATVTRARWANIGS
ncbi:Dos2-interacting transcription regulator of RNA-Pol-II-domain-containing protein, partial [Hyaloraphidium curvatum]